MSYKVGNVKRARVSQIPYVIQFTKVSDKDVEGRAYEPAGLEGKNRGKYVGKFVRGVATINTSVKENNTSYGGLEIGTNVAKPKEEAPIKPPAESNIKPVAQVNTKAKTKKKRIVVNAPTSLVKAPASLVKAPATKLQSSGAPIAGVFFQGQEGLGCGRHALNNLLGRVAFVKGSLSDTLMFPPAAEPYSLLGLCKYVTKIMRKKGLYEICDKAENYDDNTMTSALDLLGYSYLSSIGGDVDESRDMVGVLVNLGLKAGKPKHWVSLKFQERRADGTVVYTYFDSLNKGPIPNVTLAEFNTEYPGTYKLTVFLPKGQPIDPAAKFSTQSFTDFHPDKVQFFNDNAMVQEALGQGLAYKGATLERVEKNFLEQQIAEAQGLKDLRAGTAAQKHARKYVVSLLYRFWADNDIPHDKSLKTFIQELLATAPKVPVTPCTTYYDPCTKKALTSLEELEARVAELRAATAAATTGATTTETKKGGKRNKTRKQRRT